MLPTQSQQYISFSRGQSHTNHVEGTPSAPDANERVGDWKINIDIDAIETKADEAGITPIIRQVQDIDSGEQFHLKIYEFSRSTQNVISRVELHIPQDSPEQPLGLHYIYNGYFVDSDIWFKVGPEGNILYYNNESHVYPSDAAPFTEVSHLDSLTRNFIIDHFDLNDQFTESSVTSISEEGPYLESNINNICNDTLLACFGELEPALLNSIVGDNGIRQSLLDRNPVQVPFPFNSRTVLPIYTPSGGIMYMDFDTRES